MNIEKDQLIENITNQLCNVVNMKILLNMYYDDKSEYLEDIEYTELLEYAKEYLDLSKENIEKKITILRINQCTE